MTDVDRHAARFSSTPHHVQSLHETGGRGRTRRIPPATNLRHVNLSQLSLMRFLAALWQQVTLALGRRCHCVGCGWLARGSSALPAREIPPEEKVSLA
jgi:hypothetical protein